MQAYSMTSPPVRTNNLPSQQQTPCRGQPGPTSQSGYYSVQQRTSNQRNAYQPVGLNNGHSFSLQPHSSSANLQPSPVRRNDLPVPTAQTAHYGVQQKTLSHWNNFQSHGSSNAQCSQTNSGSANLQSSQPSQQQFTNAQRQMLYMSQSSFKGPFPNVTVQQLPAAHPEISSVNYPSQSLHTNTTPQGYNNMPSLQNGNNSSHAVRLPSVIENNQLHGSTPPTFQPLSGQHNRMQTLPHPAAQPQQTSSPYVQVSQVAHRTSINQGQMRAVRNGASYGSAAQPPAAAQAPPSYRSQHILINHGQSPHNVNQLQNSSLIQNHPSSYRTQNVSQSQENHSVLNGQSSPSHGPLRRLDVQSQAEQRTNRSSSIELPHEQIFGDIFEEVRKRQELQRRSGVPSSGHHSSTSRPSFPAHQHNTGPQGLQSNSTTAALPRTSTSLASFISQAPHPTCSGPIDPSRVTLLELLLRQENEQVHDQGNSPPSFSNSRAQTVENRGAPQETASPATSVAVYSQAQASHCSVPSNSGKGVFQRVVPAPSMETGIDKGERLKAVGAEGTQSSRSQTKRRDEQHREVEHCTDPADCLALVMALQRAARKFHRAVAVVPPISQQTDPGQKEDAPAGPDDSPPCKIDAVWTLDEGSKGMEKELMAPSLPKEINMEACSVTMQETVKPGTGPTVNTQSDAPAKILTGPQAESGSASKSHTSQAPVCIIDLTENHDPDKSYLDHAPGDSSTVPVNGFTLDKLQRLVKSVEATPVDEGKGKETAADVKSGPTLKSHSAQAPICTTGSTESVEQQNHDPDESYLDHAPGDSSTVPVNGFTLDKLQRLVKSVEATPVDEGKGKETAADVKSGPTLKSHSSQAPICTTGSTESVEQQNRDPDSHSARTVFDLSTVPVTDFTLRQMQRFVKFLEATTTDKGRSKNKETTTDVIKSILDLYWGGDLRNLLKERDATTWLNTICEMRVTKKQDVVFQFLKPDKLKILPGCYVLENELPSPTQFKSSWLNVDGSPADIDKVLAEPVSEYDFTWCYDAMFDSAMKPKDGHVQTSGQDAEDLVVSTQIESSETTSDNVAVNPEHSLVQGGGSDAKDMVVSTQKELAETTSDNAVIEVVDSDSCLSEPGSPEVKEKSLQDQTDIQQHHTTDHQIRDGNRNPADFMHSTEKSDGLSKSNKEECKNDHGSTIKDVFSSPLNLKSKPNDPLEQKNRQVDEEGQTESPAAPTSHSGDSDQQVENDCEEALSSASSPNSLMMDVILLDSDDASTIFKKCDKQIGSPQEMSTVLSMLSVSQPNNLAGKAVRSPSHVMFTCPHMMDILSDGDHFCSKCWEATPLLDVDLDESLLSPDEGGLPSVTSSPVRPVGETQEEAEELFEPACSDNGRITESVLLDPKIDGSENTRAPDERQNPSPQSGTLPTVESAGPACSESVKPVVQETCEVNSSAGEESPKAVAQIRPLALSSPKDLPYKKRRLSQTVSTSADDDLFSPDIVINAAKNQHPSVHSSSGDVQSSRDYMKEKGSGEDHPPIKIKIIPVNKHSSQTETYVGKTDAQTSLRPQTSNAGKPKNVEPQKPTGLGCSPPSSQEQTHSCIKQAGLKKNIKNVKFLLYGSQSSDRDFVHQCHTQEKSSSAPVYITISQAGKNYGDVPSAKQKVYSQWSNSFVQKQNSPSCRKSHKKLERELKNRIELQKQVMKDRAMSKPVKQKRLTKGLKHKGDHTTTQEPKRFKSTIEDYFG